MIENITLPGQKNIPAMPGIVKGSLAGQLLVAAPSLQDSCFTRSVVYMCVHNEAGAMGVVVNYPVENVDIDDVIDQLNMKISAVRDVPVYFGGPVDSNRGFLIHSDDFIAEGTLYQKDGIAVTPNVTVLQALVEGRGPKHGMLVLGYAGWGAGQLESELESGSWISVPATQQLVFETDNDAKWNLAIASLGFDVGNFSATVGHA